MVFWVAKVIVPLVFKTSAKQTPTLRQSESIESASSSRHLVSGNDFRSQHLLKIPEQQTAGLLLAFVTAPNSSTAFKSSQKPMILHSGGQ